jgi:DNA-binding CsgD family transcriptional regulator
VTLRAFDKRDCPHHGPDSVYHRSRCVSCEREFGPVTQVKPPIESIPSWMRKAILGVGDASPVQTTSRRSSGVRSHDCEMSDMESRVFLSIGWGMTPTEISEQLGVSFSAVSNATVRIMDKLRVGSREQLRAVARKAARERVVA